MAAESLAGATDPPNINKTRHDEVRVKHLSHPQPTTFVNRSPCLSTPSRRSPRSARSTTSHPNRTPPQLTSPWPSRNHRKPRQMAPWLDQRKPPRTKSLISVTAPNTNRKPTAPYRLRSTRERARTTAPKALREIRTDARHHSSPMAQSDASTASNCSTSFTRSRRTATPSP